MSFLFTRAALVLVVLASFNLPTAARSGPASAHQPSEPDSTQALQSLIDRTPDGGEVRFPGGRLRMEGTLVIEERRDLTLNGNGSTIFATTTGTLKRSHLRVVGGRDIVIHDLTIVGAHPAGGARKGAFVPELEGQHGIRMEGVTGIEVTRVSVQDVYGDFIYVGRRESDARFTDGVWIHRSSFARSGRQGIAVTAGRNIVIERNRITQTGRATVDLEPNTPTWGADTVFVLDNEIGPGNLLFLAAGGGGPVNNVVVARNILRGRVLTSIIRPPEGGDRRHGIWIVDNSSDTPVTGTPIQLTKIDGLVVAGNTQPMGGDDVLVTLTDTCDELVGPNDVRPGGRELLAGRELCGTPPPRTPPDPPAVAGRPVSAVEGASPLAPSTTASTTTSPEGSSTSDVEADGGSDRDLSGIAVGTAIALIAGAGLLLDHARRRRRRRRAT